MDFSGRRLPLEMLSSMGFHISSRSWSLLDGRPTPKEALFGKLDMRPDELVMAAELGGLAVNEMRGRASVSEPVIELDNFNSVYTTIIRVLAWT